MKVRYIYKIFLVALAFVVVMSACTDDFEEINTNPNGPIVVPSDLLLGSIQEATADRLYSTFVGGDMGETWIQHWGKVQYNDEERYDVRQSIINSTWNGLYSEGLEDVVTMYELASSEGNMKNMGVALIMKGYIFSVLTEMYGPIPYAEALKADEGITSPAYDMQDVVYDSILQDLNKGVALLDGEGAISSNTDLMYGGDASKWKKFGNSLLFRTLMRVSGQRDVSAQLSAVAGKGFASNADNAELPYTGENPNGNPIWNTIVFGTRNEWKVNETLVTIMTTLNDPRLPVYAQENADGEIRGVKAGINQPVQNGYDYDNVSAIGEFFLAPDLPATFMSYSELNFLMAEAAQRGLISGSAATFYEAGITASFDTYGLDAADYIASESYNASNGLSQIGTQNYLALYSQGVEAWTEWRRTGEPALSPATDPKLGITSIPSRYPYPSDEQTLNSANYTKAAADLGGDKLTTDLWFMN